MCKKDRLLSSDHYPSFTKVATAWGGFSSTSIVGGGCEPDCSTGDIKLLINSGKSQKIFNISNLLLPQHSKSHLATSTDCGDYGKAISTTDILLPFISFDFN
jgi:hypothetical protein